MRKREEKYWRAHLFKEYQKEAKEISSITGLALVDVTNIIFKLGLLGYHAVMNERRDL